jgi:hypothetical protein
MAKTIRELNARAALGVGAVWAVLSAAWAILNGTWAMMVGLNKDVSINASTGRVTVRSIDGGKEKIEEDHLELPPDLANALLLTLLQNLRPGAAQTKVSYVAATPKPRLVKLAITPRRRGDV